MKVNQPDTSGSGGSPSIGGVITGGTQYSVLFINPANTISQDNNNFYFYDSAAGLGTNTATALSVDTQGDFSGTDSLNLYAHADAFLPNSLITNSNTGFNTDGAFPGFTTSSSRGTGASPVILNTLDTVGGFTGWGYTGVSPTYQNLGGMMVSANGSTTANLGGQLDFYTKADGAGIASRMNLTNGGFLNLSTGSARLTIGATGVTAAKFAIGTDSFSTGNPFGTAGFCLMIGSTTYNSSATAGSPTTVGMNTFGIPTLTATNAQGITTASTLYIAGAPVASTNVTIATPLALMVNSGNSVFNGNITLGIAGNKINITTGTNASIGTGTLISGTATISTTAVTASSLIFLTDTTTGALTNVGSLTVGTKTAGTSFVVNSTNVLDTSTFNWLIIN